VLKLIYGVLTWGTLMRRYLVLLLLLVCSIVWAQGTPQTNPSNANVTMMVQAEAWATSNTAKVTTRINAVVGKTGLEQVYNNVNQKLAKLSNKGNWHITSFNRSQDKSGLELVEIIAEARLPITELAAIRDHAKSVSRPGETYTIDDIDFHPSAEDMEAARSKLRTRIYELAKVELANLNKAYPDHHFVVHVINFLPDLYYSGVTAAKMNAREFVAAAAPSQPLTSSDKVQMMVVFEFVSK
jgi:hypothetical protein